MTDEARKKIYDDGWDGYFNGKTLNDCPDYPNQDERDEWNAAWLAAQSTETYMPSYTWVQSGKYPERIETGDLTN
jgi:hypothetical protein